MMITGSPNPVTGRQGKVRAAAIRRATLAGVAVILVGAGPVAAAMAAPGIPDRARTVLRAQRSCWYAGASSRSTIRAGIG